jgi:hypothetical protein
LVGERNKTRRSWSIPNAAHGQLGSLGAFSISRGSNASSISSEHAHSYISGDNPSIPSLESCSEVTNDWPSSRAQVALREDVLYRQTAQNNSPYPLPQGQLSLPPFSTQFALDEISMHGANTNANYQQQHDLGQAAGSRKDALLSPISLLGADGDMVMGSSKSSRPKEMHQSHRVRRKSVSRAERMISDVENLYEFGISLSILPEDPSLRKSLRRMKERFRSLVKTGVFYDQRELDESSSETDSDE